MADVVRRSARAILLDDEELVLIKCIKPGRDPYWVTVGGGVEAGDHTIEAALHREVFEELGGTVDLAELVYLITDNLNGGIGIQHILAARLVAMEVTAQIGTEFTKPERGDYEVVRVPFTRGALCELNLVRRTPRRSGSSWPASLEPRVRPPSHLTTRPGEQVSGGVPVTQTGTPPHY
ncbi:NUDIX domain-containing protein [Streptomyces sp. NPDC050743]|uniref:NUDIX domain-containing protein n=1 Tax=Streptomyces sp. NPDC050743 TaxID=3365634 RepID=UPI003793D1CE